MALVGERPLHGHAGVATSRSRTLTRGTLLLATVMLAMLGYACVSHALTTHRAMHLGPYLILGPRYDYTSTDLLRFPTATPGITTDWFEDNAGDGKRYRVFGRPVFMNVGGFTLLRQ